MNHSDLILFQRHPLAALVDGLRQAPGQILLASALAHLALLALAPPAAPRVVAMEPRFVELLARVELAADVPNRFVDLVVAPPAPPVEAPAPAPAAPPPQALPSQSHEPAPALRQARPERPSQPRDQAPPPTVAEVPPPQTTVAPVVTSSAGDVAPIGEAATQRVPDVAPVVVAGVAPGSATPDASSEATPPADARPEASAAPVNSDTLHRYSTRASQRLAGALRYTSEMRAAGVTGAVVLAVVIDEDGAIVEVRVERSSGSELIDQAAVRDVERLRRLPAPPRGSGIAGRTLLLPASYTIPS